MNADILKKTEQEDGGQSERSSSSSVTRAVRGVVRFPMSLPEPELPPEEDVVERTTRQIGP